MLSILKDIICFEQDMCGPNTQNPVRQFRANPLLRYRSESDFPKYRPAFLVVTAKSARDTGVVGSDATNIIVEIMESVMEAIGFEQPGHILAMHVRRQKEHIIEF
jgi:3,4-dihydroxy-2-butanone 4-phosphate synthase